MKKWFLKLINIAMGHFSELFKDDNYTIPVRNALFWAAGDDGTDMVAIE